jgi:type I restriction enzyme S subunit
LKPTVLKLGDAVDILSGFAFPSELFNDATGMPVVRIRDVVRGFSNTRYSGEVDERFVVNNGDILIGMDGNFNVARWNGGPALLNQRVCKIEARTNILDSGFLLHLLPKELKKIEDATAFVTVKHLSVKSIRDIGITLPPLHEQRRIAAILDQVNALQAKRREAFAQLDSLKQSIFNEMFGDPVTNPKGWQKLTLNELMEDGPQNGLYKPSTDYGTGTPILRIDAFYDGAVTKLNSLKRVRLSASEVKLYGLYADDIVINRVNSMEYLGKSALIPKLPEPTVFESNMMRFSVNRDIAEPGYIVQFLQTKFIKSQILACSKNAVNQSSINQQDVKGFQINVPPVKLQEAFSARCTTVEAVKTTHYAALTQLDVLFASLQHRAFRGEL